MLFYGSGKTTTTTKEASFARSLSEDVHYFIEYLGCRVKRKCYYSNFTVEGIKTWEVKQDHQPTSGIYIKSYFHPSQAKLLCRLPGKRGGMWPHLSDQEQASTTQASIRGSSLAQVAKERAPRSMADATDWSCEWVQFKQCSDFPCAGTWVRG